MNGEAALSGVKGGEGGGGEGEEMHQEDLLAPGAAPRDALDTHKPEDHRAPERGKEAGDVRGKEESREGQGAGWASLTKGD